MVLVSKYLLICKDQPRVHVHGHRHTYAHTHVLSLPDAIFCLAFTTRHTV